MGRSAAVMRDSAGAALFVIGAFVDLTEQRQKDRALHQMNGFLTAIVENSPVAIYTTDTDGIINFWNRLNISSPTMPGSMDAMLGLTAAALT